MKTCSKEKEIKPTLKMEGTSSATAPLTALVKLAELMSEGGAEESGEAVKRLIAQYKWTGLNLKRRHLGFVCFILQETGG